jgi:ABC-type transporter Mla MlaB component
MEVGRLSSKALLSGDELGIGLSGLAELPDQQNLGRLMRALHQAAQQQQVRLVELDLRGMRFMNSSCFKELVTWLASAQAVSAGQRYAVRFVADPLVRWQRSGAAALVTFAGDLVVSSSHRSHP